MKNDENIKWLKNRNAKCISIYIIDKFNAIDDENNWHFSFLQPWNVWVPQRYELNPISGWQMVNLHCIFFIEQDSDKEFAEEEQCANLNALFSFRLLFMHAEYGKLTKQCSLGGDSIVLAHVSKEEKICAIHVS